MAIAHAETDLEARRSQEFRFHFGATITPVSDLLASINRSETRFFIGLSGKRVWKSFSTNCFCRAIQNVEVEYCEVQQALLVSRIESLYRLVLIESFISVANHPIGAEM